MRMTPEEIVKQDLMIQVGTGLTESVGSDSYGFYVSEVLGNGVYGIYSAPANWSDKNPYYGGTMETKAFDPTHKSEFYIKRSYGHWWRVHPNGKRISRFSGRYCHISFGHAYNYRDPSF